MFVVKRYGYRNAWVQNTCLHFPSIWVRPLREMLAVMAKVRPDNHEVYQVSGPIGKNVYIGFSDNQCIIGASIHVESTNLVTEINRGLPSDLPVTAGGAGIFDWIESQRVPGETKLEL